ncbi:MAG: Mur ligase family protein, partial [Deinococcales bacterium]
MEGAAAVNAIDVKLLRELGPVSEPRTPLPRGTGVAFHSDRVRPGDVFFALPGEHGHGMAYAEQAIARGAAFIVSDLPHERGLVVDSPGDVLLDLGRRARRGLRGPVVGITGSAGKTTTKTLLRAALDGRASEGNFNTPWALASTLVEAALDESEKGDPRALVLELGIDQLGEMARLIDLTHPDHAVLTAIGASHLAGLGTVDAVALEKGALLMAAPGQRLASLQAFGLLPPALRENVHPYAVLDADEPSPTAPNLIPARRLSTTAEGQELVYRGLRVQLPWPGKALADNALAALAMAERLGHQLEDAAARLCAAQLEPGRLERRVHGRLTIIDDTYNSNPASASLALEVLRGSPPPRAAVLGDMLELGEASAAHHHALGAATRDLDVVVAVGPEAAAIAAANPSAHHALDPEAAEALLAELPEHGTVLFKASRGMHLERLLARFEASLDAPIDASHEGHRS